MPKTALVLAALFLGLGVISAFSALNRQANEPSASGTPTPQQTGNRWSVTVTATDAGFDTALDALPPGAAALELVVDAASPQELQVFRVEEGVRYQTFAKATRRLGRDPRLFRLASPVGGVGAGGGIPPGGSARLVLDLPVGVYAFVSFVGDAHENGMIRRFDVRAGEVAPAGIPSTVGEIVMNDDTFALPSQTLPPGVYRISNAGAKAHEAAIFALEGSLDSLIAQLDSGGAEGAGGFGLLGPSLETYSQIALEPGSYVFVCRVADRPAGRPHYESGMISEFRIE